MIHDASHGKGVPGDWPADRLAEATPKLYWQAPVNLAQAMAAPIAPKSEAIEAYVNEARWIAECPDCHSAQMAAREDKRFMCHECANVAIGGMWRPVVWPKGVRDLEVVLDKRKSVNAHWLPGESVADLRAENKTHGLD